MSGDERKIAERMLMTELKELEKENWVHAEVFPSQLSAESWLDREADEVLPTGKRRQSFSVGCSVGGSKSHQLVSWCLSEGLLKFALWSHDMILTTTFYYCRQNSKFLKTTP
jgi:hypothetical protein